MLIGDTNATQPEPLCDDQVVGGGVAALPDDPGSQQLVSSTLQVFNSSSFVYKSPGCSFLVEDRRAWRIPHWLGETNEMHPWSLSANERGARPGLNS